MTEIHHTIKRFLGWMEDKYRLRVANFVIGVCRAPTFEVRRLLHDGFQALWLATVMYGLQQPQVKGGATF
ncbi:hypothetical protein Hypma_014177 [Hypsizygus marmoreus]|uniref:Uncharacterized protein n=1 Tax=Hypsizygus marmoreus TaxID=39966 RepID=A0A369KAI6_HYPMA|nr:hypothetical protein Hypma_014177 [Hypsizygus marmoreus]